MSIRIGVMGKVSVLIFAICIFAGPALAQQWVVVRISKDSLRRKPELGGKVNSPVKRNDRLQVLSQRDKWYFVQDGYQTGWIRSSSVMAEPTGRSGSGVGNGSGSGPNGYGTGNGQGTGTGKGDPNGTGVGVGPGGGGYVNGNVAASIIKPLVIISKPRPTYTDPAKNASVQGTVVLRVTFLASGRVGSISPVKGLSHGLTEQAIAAARLITFKPAESKDGPISVTKTVEYSFVPY